MLANVPLFADLDADAVAALAQQTKRKHYQKRTVIIEKGDESSSLYVLEQGRAKVYVADDVGREIVLRELGPGDHFGELALLSVCGHIAKVLVDQSRDEGGRLMTPALTQQQIADRVGCSREMVSRIIGDLKTGGYISLEGKRFVLERKLPERW